MMAFNSVMQRAVLERDALHRVTGAFHSLRNGLRHFAGLARAHADGAVAVAHNRERRESENTAALDGLADAVDRDHLFTQAVVLFFDRVFTLNLSHCQHLG